MAGAAQGMIRGARYAGAAALLVAGALAVGAGRAAAHGLEPALLSLRGLGGGRYEVTWRSSKLRLPGAAVEPVLPARCRASGAPPLAVDEGDRMRMRWSVDCGPSGLAGEVIRLADLDVATIDALLRIESPGADTIQTVLTAHTPSFVVPAQPNRAEVLRSYTARGIAHILSGPDHLLFIVGLLLLVPTAGLLVRTITAFTLGHSVMLAAVALHRAALPSRPVALLIALSVLVLAVELARPADRATWLRRFPWAIALLFGLLHGFGFAGALTGAALPAGDVPTALLAFNGGIELGQLAFVGAVLGAGWGLTRWAPSLARRARQARCMRWGSWRRSGALSDSPRG
ncbi:MAG: HupE/UreJ family protein [bacterium]